MKTWEESNAAFFDVDGTLVRGASLELRFVRNYWRSRQLSTSGLMLFGLRRLAAYLFQNDRGRRDKSYLLGCAYADLQKAGKELVNGGLEGAFIQESIRRIERHLERGCRCFLLTGTLDFLACSLGERIGVRNILSTRLEVVDGLCTGRIIGTHPYGHGKKALFEETCREEGLSPEKCAAYADRLADLSLLQSVGYPCAVNPDRKLFRVAQQKGWEILAC